MEKWHELGKELRRFINPDTFPVAVQLLTPEIQIPEGVKTPLKDLKVKIARCRFDLLKSCPAYALPPWKHLA